MKRHWPRLSSRNKGHSNKGHSNKGHSNKGHSNKGHSENVQGIHIFLNTLEIGHKTE